MTDPISALLIIGAAVIGPINAVSLMSEINCKKQNEATICVADERFETLPELCARAMKEIGAIRLEFPYETGTRVEWVLFDTGAKPPDKIRVRCIPTPSGYRK